MMVSFVLGLIACQPGPVDPPFARQNIRAEVDYLNLKIPHENALKKTGVDSLWTKSLGKNERGDSVVVAVVGTGIDYTNPDLRDSLWINQAEIGDKNWNNSLDDDNNGYADDLFGYDFFSGDGLPYDWHGHDTYTASIIAASGSKNKKVVGVAPQARLMVLRYMGPDGRGSAMDAQLAIQYAIRNRARVIYLNWPNQGFGERWNQLVIKAIEDAGRANILVVIPAGNDANQNVSGFIQSERLQNFEHVMIVSGADARGGLSASTNYGRRLSAIAAPAEGSWGFFPGHEAVKDGLKTSSVAAAYVTGAAALLAALPNMGRASDIRKALLEGALIPRENRLEVLSGGLLDLASF
jgi:subtilisin family serine protease